MAKKPIPSRTKAEKITDMRAAYSSPAPTPKPDAITFGEFTFVVDTVDEFPAETVSRVRQTELPFYDMFAKFGHGQGSFVPKAFFLSRAAEGADPVKITHGVMKAKMRDWLKRWKDKDPSRAAVNIRMVSRVKGSVAREGAEPFTDDGISFWMDKQPIA